MVGEGEATGREESVERRGVSDEIMDGSMAPRAHFGGVGLPKALYIIAASLVQKQYTLIRSSGTVLLHRLF